MALSQNDKNRIAIYKKDIEQLKAQKTRLKDNKRDRVESLKRSKSNATSASSKASFAQQIISTKQNVDNQIYSLNERIDRLKETISNIRS